MADDESTNLQAMLEDQHPTLDKDYWNELSRKITSRKLSVDSMIFSFPISVQGDMDAIFSCSTMPKDKATSWIKIMENRVNNAEPFGCGFFMTFGIPLAMDFIIIFVLFLLIIRHI